MNIIDNILKIINHKNMTKKEFASKLINLEPRIGKNAEVPSERTIYLYLSKERELKAELIPYIADVLDVSEQSLFDSNEKVRSRVLKDILASINNREKSIIDEFCINQHPKQIANILRLLEYAPKVFIDNIETKLHKFKKISKDI